jgi:prepilin-type N-terminal cleavage/methylation domain-containing protein/prepilin-type processing-associated H-X9-DG protein
MNQSRAFTLIELLVVIAIIAILAAILFPVFAQAKAAAKSVADLSNVKQISLGLLMYSNDSDDQFPYAFDNDWGNPLVWPVITQPYIKSLDLFHSPFDTNKLQATSDFPANTVADMGVAISYGANSAVFWDSGYGGASANACQGPIVYYPALTWGGASNPSPGCTSMGQTQINHIADTILLSDRFTQDLQKIGDPGNPSGAPVGNVFVFPSSTGGYTDGNEYYNGSFPDGSAPTTNPYPFGPSGGVSITNANKANFAMTDGHAKSMTPAQTNPSTWNQPENNMWSARRQ